MLLVCTSKNQEVFTVMSMFVLRMLIVAFQFVGKCSLGKVIFLGLGQWLELL